MLAVSLHQYPVEGKMYKQAFVGIAAAALLLAGCSRQAAIQSVSAQSPSPEPVDRSATANAQPGPAPSQPVETAYYPPPAEPGSRRTYDGPIIPTGTLLHVRLDESLGTKHDPAGERFYASLADPIVMDGHTLLPVGTRFSGHISQSKPSGHFKGRAVLAVRLDAFEWRGRQYPIATSSIERVSHRKKGLRWIAGGGGLGALIGGIAGGGPGALIGGAAGAGAGTAGSLVSGKRQVHLLAETPLRFTLRNPVQL
jgi:hypothetical protein